jgi:hypothetical protein
MPLLLLCMLSYAIFDPLKQRTGSVALPFLGTTPEGVTISSFSFFSLCNLVIWLLVSHHPSAIITNGFFLVGQFHYCYLPFFYAIS